MAAMIQKSSLLENPQTVSRALTADNLDQVAQALPMGEVVDAVELGRYVAFALSDQLPHLTGTHLKIDAGRTL